MDSDSHTEQIVAMGLLHLLGGSCELINHIDNFLYVPIFEQVGDDEDWFQIICHIPFMSFVYNIQLLV